MSQWSTTRRSPRTKLRGRLGAAAAALAALLLLPSATLPAEQPAHLELGYLGYLGAIQVVRVDVSIALGPEQLLPDRYRMTVDIAMLGALQSLFRFHMRATAVGAHGEAGVKPARYTNTMDLRDRRRTMTLTYRPGGRVDIAAQPPSAESQAAKARQIGRSTVDPLSATIAIVSGAVRTGACDGRIPVFDGERRYDLALEDAGRGEVRKLGFSMYEGSATECIVHAAFLDGFREKEVKAGLYPETTNLWLAPVIADAPAVPVRLSSRIALGSIRLDLVDARIVPASTP